MNTVLLDNIYNSIFKAVSASTCHVYFDYLPDEKLLKDLTIVYELRNSSNDQTFDSKEANKFYELTVKANAPTLDKLKNQSIYIKDQLYSLPVCHITLANEDLFFDPDTKVWTAYSEYELQAE